MPSTVKGVAYSPLGFPETYENTDDFYSEIDQIGDFSVFMNTLWRDSEERSEEIPEAHLSLMKATNSNCFTPVSGFGWIEGDFVSLRHPDLGVNNWTNEVSREAFINMLVEYVTTYEPPYVFIGNEVNFYYDNFPDDYTNWVEFYGEAYSEIKSTGTETKVGTIFNFEHVAGIGKNVGWNEPQWGAIDQFDPNTLDVIGLTMYPYLSEDTPQAISNSYLSPLLQRDAADNTPIFITETGWPGDASLDETRSWRMGEEFQTSYIQKLGDVVNGVNVIGLNWLFMNEMRNTCSSCNKWINFGSVSLKDSLGNKRPAYDTFLDLSF
ncbi:hypothetical protein [Gracilimonas sp.]|uniref:hypothetical protein n=1 Tax=Gracilimonas sp. TaxID=1974203 RepID=UPI002871FA49|nr:hypothetical protein [Gracilimonas sp.]